MAPVAISCENTIKNSNSNAFQDWLKERRFSHRDFDIDELATTVQRKRLVVTVIIPGKEVASTIGGVIEHTVRPLIEAKVVSHLFVVDANSVDGTGQVAADAGAQVIQRKDIAPELGSSRGKGDALWRGLLATKNLGDIVAFLDGDTADPSSAHLIGILGPLLLLEDISMVRACFDRPFKSASGEVRPHEGGRVTEILARPLLNMYWPDLAGFRQPLAGEFAARRELLEKLSFPVGYGVEIGTLIDTYSLIGLLGIAEVDVGQRQNAHKALRELTTMAKAILSTAEKRLHRGSFVMKNTEKMFLPWTDDFCDVDDTERPPIVDYFHSFRELSPSTGADNDFTCEQTHEENKRLKAQDVLYPSPPFVDIEGVRMFRDIGNKIVKRGLVFRSGDPSKITELGRKAFLKLGITKLFDLRSPIEVHNDVHSTKEVPHRKDSAAQFMEESRSTFALLLQDVERVAIPVFSDEDWLPEKREARLQEYATAAKGYAAAYQHTLKCGVSAFRPIFEHLAQDSPTPILVHCSAGKDRTGITAMLLMLLAGCDTSTIAKEYALNNLDSNMDWGSHATRRLLAQPGLAGNVAAVANVVQAREEYMVATIEMFDQVFGGIDTYMTDYLCFDTATVAKIRMNLCA
ncbi:hypothetical protein AAFC00_006856 [Neodothiora populina]|uniref:Tyrosine specific protein phosphatases domain-containing protein n=1 Tax=Neodothiora populina TaxID=2781224 RepID=A0ABR3PCL3_9PEZI